MNKSRGLTLIETGIVGLVAVITGSLTIGGLSSMSEKAQSAKCLNNLKRSMTAIQLYTGDNEGLLPGRCYPIISTRLHMMPENIERKVFLTWFLRPYFEPVADSSTNPATANPVIDKIFTCPTTALLIPGASFSYSTLSTPSYYTLNNFGPTSSMDKQWYHTDPPFYFGATSAYGSEMGGSQGVPDSLYAINNASIEWATGDAWTRKVPTGTTRPGQPTPRSPLGTFPYSLMTNPYPAVPPHEIPYNEAGLNSGSFDLPRIALKGKTNLSYFDGHASGFVGTWADLNNGGTVNPYWSQYGGYHTSWQP